MLTYNYTKTIQNIDKPSGRVYETPVGCFPSITTVLGATANKIWLQRWIESVGEEEANRIKESAAERGTILHNYLERLYEEYESPTKEQARNFIDSSGLSEEKPFIKKMTVELIKHLLVNNFRSVAQEFVVWDEELKVAGRCDGVGYWNNNLVVIDYKTSRKKKTISQIKDYYLQATFYCNAHNKMFDKKVNSFIILMAVEDGTSVVFTGSPNHYLPELKNRIKGFYDKKKDYQ
jgi:ATP-dependent exoDNAse (exonuclease V) beta subunit